LTVIRTDDKTLHLIDFDWSGTGQTFEQYLESLEGMYSLANEAAKKVYMPVGGQTSNYFIDKTFFESDIFPRIKAYVEHVGNKKITITGAGAEVTTPGAPIYDFIDAVTGEVSTNTDITKPTFVHDDGLCKHPEINDLTLTSTKEYNGKNIVISPKDNQVLPNSPSNTK
jgi:hypothetical protein